MASRSFDRLAIFMLMNICLATTVEYRLNTHLIVVVEIIVDTIVSSSELVVFVA